jgi:hypothetical protein
MICNCFTASPHHCVHRYGQFIKGLWSLVKTLTHGLLIPDQAPGQLTRDLYPIGNAGRGGDPVMSWITCCMRRAHG